jgi:hypothetical protein
MHRNAIRLTLAAAAIAVTACRDSTAPPATDREPEAPSAAIGTRAPSTVAWNRRAVQLGTTRPVNPARLYAYLSIAQYRAILAAEARSGAGARPSPAGASAGAAVAVLSAFFPSEAASLESELAAQRAAAQASDPAWLDFAAGEAIGRAAGATIMAYAASDQVEVARPGPLPVGPGYWTSSGAPIVLALYGARPFFLTSHDQVRPAPHPAFGSPAFLADLAEVRRISDTRTPEQLDIARRWGPPPPLAHGLLNMLADDLIERHGRTERGAARALAYANAAVWDGIVGCWDAKFHYWLLRPTQADPQITLAVPLPNHPSYPSAHSCVFGAFTSALATAFPDEEAMLSAVADSAGIARIYAGIHYRFDVTAGLAIGRAVAGLALAGGLEHVGGPID